MTRRICITGPEATGKSFLAEALSARFGCPWVPEYARDYLNKIDRPYRENDLEEILRGQLALENSTGSESDDFLFCDTGPEVIWVWSQYKYGRVSPFIERLTREHSYDLTLLLSTDLPWTPDPLRENPSECERHEIFKLFRCLLTRIGRKHVTINGQGNDRILNACKHLWNGRA